MKKKITTGWGLKLSSAGFALFVFACTLFTVGCPSTKSNHTDTAFLVGEWANEEKGNNFTIKSDLSFECGVTVPDVGQGKVTGRLDAKDEKLGPNDYLLRDMKTVGSNADYPANPTIEESLPMLKDLLATLTPSSDKETFTFSSPTTIANVFFGGKYTKRDRK